MAEKKDQVAKETATDKKKTAKKTTGKTEAVVAKEAPAAKKASKAAAPVASSANPDRYRLKKFYAAEVAPALMKDRGYTNVWQVPKLEKVILNMRLGDIKDNSKSIQLAQAELEAIAGQKAVLVKAKKSVANFKLREGQPIGIKVTLRGNKMYEFFDKLVSVALPRVRDFRGISSNSFDGRGNYAMGVKEQIMFPEIPYETVEKVRGFDICVVTTAKSDDEAKALLVKLGMPFKN